MKVSAESLFDLARASHAPADHRPEGVVRWATDQLRRAPSRAAYDDLRRVAGEVHRYLTDPDFNPRHDVVAENLRRALEACEP